MGLKRSLFGRVKTVICDRCGRTEKPTYLWAAFCEQCNSIPATSIRNEDVGDEGWTSFDRGETKQLKCSLCGKSETPETFSHVCIACYAKHPDTTHGGSWGYAPHRVGNVEVDHCFWCNGVCIREKQSDEETHRTYYKVGNKEPVDQSYVCTHDYERLKERQKHCQHEYISVFSNARTEKEAKAIESDLRQQPFVVSIMKSDMAGLEYNIAYASEGSTHFWCWKCGFYRNLNPSRYSLLPTRGDGGSES